MIDFYLCCIWITLCMLTGIFAGIYYLLLQITKILEKKETDDLHYPI